MNSPQHSPAAPVAPHAAILGPLPHVQGVPIPAQAVQGYGEPLVFLRAWRAESDFTVPPPAGKTFNVINGTWTELKTGANWTNLQAFTSSFSV